MVVTIQGTIIKIVHRRRAKLTDRITQPLTGADIAANTEREQPTRCYKQKHWIPAFDR
jgi:hypothetical protein